MKRTLALLTLAMLITVPASGESEYKKMARACSKAAAAPEKAVKSCGWLLDVSTLGERNRSSVHYLRGVAHFVLEAWEAARSDFTTAIHFQSRNAPAYVARGSTYFQQERYEEAIRDFNLAIKIQPNLSRAFNNRANSQVKIGKYESALGDYEKAIRFRSKFITAFIDRSLANRHADRHEEADEDIRKAMHISDGSAEAYNALAWHFATADHAQARNGEKAVTFAKRAVELQAIPIFIDTLAAAHAEAGQFEDAVREQKRAIELFETNDKEDSGSRMAGLKSRLELYRSGQAYRAGPEAPPAGQR